MSETTQERVTRLVNDFDRRVQAVSADGWSSPAPCDGWTARDVVVHILTPEARDFYRYYVHEKGDWQAARNMIDTFSLEINARTIPPEKLRFNVFVPIGNDPEARVVVSDVSGGKLILSVTNPDSGSATEELEVEYASDPLDIGFNSRYLLDIAAQIEGEVAVLRLADPGSPTLVQDKDNKGALYVLMPMRV